MSKTIGNVYKGAAGTVINIDCVRVSLGNRVSVLVYVAEMSPMEPWDS